MNRRTRRNANAMLNAYNRLLHTRPLLTNCITGGALGALGDVFAQRLEQQDGEGAVLKAAITGVVMNGLFVPFWYRKLDAMLPGTTMKAISQKTLADIAVPGAMGNAAAIAARGSPIPEVLRRMPEVLFWDCTVFVPYNLIAFGKIPLHIRPSVTALVTLGWNTYLSSVAAQGRSAG